MIDYELFCKIRHLKDHGLTSLHDDFISHHDRRGYGQTEFHILDIPEFLPRPRYRFDLNGIFVFSPQPGDHF